MKEVKKHIIDGATMAITPTFDEYGNRYSNVHEKESTVFVKQKPLDIIKESCEYYGSSLNGCVAGTKKVMGGFPTMTPIALCAGLELFFLPLEAPKNVECIWLAYNYVSRVVSTGSIESEIFFKNGFSFTVPQSKDAVISKIYRTAHYRCTLLERWRPPLN